MGVINKTTEEINTLLDKVELMPEEGVVGKTPVLETGTTTTLPAGSNATSEVVRSGTDISGNPKYRLNFGIPKGADGSSSGGGGTADSVEWVNVLNKPTWVNSSVKPTYTATEVGALPATTTMPSKTSQLTNDSGFVASSGLKTINGQSIVGSGNIEISGTGSGIDDAPSDGKTYGRKDGNWSAIEGVGGSVDITDIMARLIELSNVGGTCTDEDYNALKGYAENGVTTYADLDGSVFGIDLSFQNGIITVDYSMLSGYYFIRGGVIISENKQVNEQGGTFFPYDQTGNGLIGDSYSKPSAYSSITQDDTISDAIGKLEAAISNGSSSDFYYVPSAVLTLRSSATSDEILAAFGGSEKRTELANAVKEGKIIVIEGSGAYGSAIVPHCYTLGGILVYLSFIRNSVGNPENVRISLGLSSSITVTYANGFKLSSKINVLKSSSTSGEISFAIGGLEGILALKKAVEDGNTISADADNSVIGANEISGRMQLSVIVAKYNTSYSIVISGVQGSSHYAALSASYLAIDYNTVSNTFSCQKYVIGNISIAE